LEACDVSRVDFRIGADDEPYLMEINTLPGLNPAESDLCIMAAAEGIPYQTLITEILYLAAQRFGMPFEPANAAWQTSMPDRYRAVHQQLVSVPASGDVITNG